MNIIPDFVSDELMKNIIEINRDVDDVYDVISEKIDQPIHLIECIGKGGSSIVYKASYGDMLVAIKLCDFDKYACLAFKDEVKNAYEFLQLNQLKRCYNYPMMYGYFHSCLFFEWNELKEIVDYINENDDEIMQKKDAFILYCTTPSHVDLPDDLKKYVARHFSIDFILKSVEKMPKSKNSIGLINYLMGCEEDWRWEKWENSRKIYDYLFDLEMNETICSVFVMQQFLQGKTLDTYKNKLTDMIFFEYVYSMLISVLVLGKTLDDVHADNMMIVGCNVLRLYFYNLKYYAISGDMFYHIDLAVTNDRYQSRKVNKSTFSVISNLFTNEQKEWIDTYATGLASDVLSYLFEWLDKRGIRGMNEEEAKICMIESHNYKQIDANV